MSDFLLSDKAQALLLGKQRYRLLTEDVVLSSQCYRNPQGEQLRVAVCQSGDEYPLIKVSADGDAYLWAAALWAAEWCNHLVNEHSDVPDDQAIIAAVDMPMSRISAAVLVRQALEASQSLLDSRQSF